MRGKKPIRLGKGKLLSITEKPSLKNHSLRNWPTLARAQAKSVSEEQTEKGLTLKLESERRQARVPLDIRQPN